MSDQPLSVIPFLHALAGTNGSDLHCKVGSAPRVRVDGRLRKLQVPDLRPIDTENMLIEVLPEDLVDHYRRTHEADFAYSLKGVGRFRVNAYQARGTNALVFRRVAVGAQSLTELGLPEVVGELALEPRGLVLVTGPTGSGKTTTLASMVDLINSYREVNIVTIEDPIEVLHSDKKAIVSQREVRQDTADFNTALRAAMRQDPDVILVGEIRDLETAQIAVQASLTGHLVLSTLHTNDAPSSIIRLIDLGVEPFLLTATLEGIVAQRLVRTLNQQTKEAYTPSEQELMELDLTPADVQGRQFFRPGSASGVGGGYKGRMALFEIMRMDDELRELVMKEASTAVLRASARRKGMRSLRESGLMAIYEGLTTIDEVVRETLAEE